MKKIIDLHLESLEVFNQLSAMEKMMKEDSSRPGKACYGNLHNLVISDFTESISNNKKPYLSLKEASKANEVVLGFYQSTSTGETVNFPMKEYKQPNLNESKAVRSI